MKKATIISGENKGKSGEVIGMFFGAGICVIKADDGKEYTAKLDEIKTIYPINKKTVIGLSKEMICEIANKLDMIIFSCNGNVCFHDCKEYREYSQIECEESFLDILKTEYGIELPTSNYTLFASEGKQEFDFYIGIMF